MNMIIKAAEAETMVGMARVERAHIDMAQVSAGDALATATVHSANFRTSATPLPHQGATRIDTAVAASR